jgi:hypothetical protein
LGAHRARVDSDACARRAGVHSVPRAPMLLGRR